MSELRLKRILAAAAFTLVGPGAWASELPPADGQPLSLIIEAVERAHAGVVISAEFDERRWEVVSCSADGRQCREILIDPRSAKELRNSRDMNFDVRPPSGGRTASQIARAVEERKLGTITEIEFENNLWEVSMRGNNVRAKLFVDPATGEVQGCSGRGCPVR